MLGHIDIFEYTEDKHVSINKHVYVNVITRDIR